jgi:hypothetical protein
MPTWELALLAVLVGGSAVTAYRIAHSNPNRTRIEQLRKDIGRMRREGTNPACINARETELQQLQAQ